MWKKKGSISALITLYSNGKWAISTIPCYQLFNFHDKPKYQGHLTRLIGESELQKLGGWVGVRWQCVWEGETGVRFRWRIFSRRGTKYMLWHGFHWQGPFMLGLYQVLLSHYWKFETIVIKVGRNSSMMETVFKEVVSLQCGSSVCDSSSDQNSTVGIFLILLSHNFMS